jgi:hypothetical protein
MEKGKVSRGIGRGSGFVDPGHRCGGGAIGLDSEGCFTYCRSFGKILTGFGVRDLRIKRETRHGTG